MGFIAVAQNSAPVTHEVELFLARILNWLASSMRIDCQFSEAGNALRQPGLNVSLAKDRSVVTGATRQVIWMLEEGGHMAVQPSRLDLPLLGQQDRLDHNHQQDEPSHWRDPYAQSEPGSQLARTRTNWKRGSLPWVFTQSVPATRRCAVDYL